jgi:hypothetical protein
MLSRPGSAAKLQSIVSALELESDALRQVSESFNNFSLRLLDYATYLIPEKPALAEHVTNQYDRLVTIDNRRSQAVRRSADDLRDILERKVVIDRLTSQYQEFQKEYDRRKAEYLRVKGKPEEVEARAYAIVSLELAKKGLRALIEQTERFSRFAERRMKHAFAVYGETLALGNEAEESVLVALIAELSTFSSE